MSPSAPDIAEALRTIVEAISAPRNDPPPHWRVVSAEAVRRGFPTARAFRDWCHEHGVPLKGSGKHQTVSIADLDRAHDRIAARKRSEPRERHRDVKPENSAQASLAKAGLRVVTPAQKGAR